MTPSSENTQDGHGSSYDGSSSPVATKPSGVGFGAVTTTGAAWRPPWLIARRHVPAAPAARDHAHAVDASRRLRPRAAVSGAANWRPHRAGGGVGGGLRAANDRLRRSHDDLPVHHRAGDRRDRGVRLRAAGFLLTVSGRGIGLIAASASFVARIAGSTRMRAKMQTSARMTRNHESSVGDTLYNYPRGRGRGALDLGAGTGTIRIRPHDLEVMGSSLAGERRRPRIGATTTSR